MLFMEINKVLTIDEVRQKDSDALFVNFDKK